MPNGEYKDALRSLSVQAAREGRKDWSGADERCIHCGKHANAHIYGSPPPNYADRTALALAYCDETHAAIFEAWWMR